MDASQLYTRTAIVVLGLAIFGASACADDSTANSTTDSLGIDSALLRLAISVSDIEKSKRFYSYGLGYRIGFDGDITNPDVAAKLQLQEDQTARFVVLHGAEEIAGEPVSGAMIGLMHIDNPPVPAIERPGPATIASGEGVLAIVASDMDLVWARMQELGATILYPPTKSPDGTESELVVYDPDGIRVHIVVHHAAQQGKED